MHDGEIHPNTAATPTDPEPQRPDASGPRKNARPLRSRLPALLGRILLVLFAVAAFLAFIGALVQSIHPQIGRVLILMALIAGALAFTFCGVVVVLLGTFTAVTSVVRNLLAVPRTLFFRAQIRLTDLILIVALLGNAEGMLFAYLPEYYPHAIPACALLLTIWIMGGAAWGLWVATVMDEKSTWVRWQLILLGGAAPMVPPALAFCGFRVVSTEPLPFLEYAPPFAIQLTNMAFGFLSLIATLMVAAIVLRIHKAAKAKHAAKREAP